MGLVERQLVSIDWDVRTLRVVFFALRSKGPVRIKKVVSATIPAEVSRDDPVAFGRLLRAVLDREGIDGRRWITTSGPRRRRD